MAVDCAVVNQLFTEMTGFINSEVYAKTINSDPLMKLTPRGEWKDGVGFSYQFSVYERMLPVTEPNPTNLGDSDNTVNGTCNPTGEQLPDPGTTLKTVQLKSKKYRTPSICVNDIRFANDAVMRLNNVVLNLSETTKLFWSQQILKEYIAGAGHKIVLDNVNHPSEGTTSFPLTTPNYQLSMNTLKAIAARLRFLGGDGEALEHYNGRPIYQVLTDETTMDNLIKENADIREDYRFADMGKGSAAYLLQPLGVDKVYGNFHLMSITYPKRYNFVNGAWVNIWPFDAHSDATIGTNVEVAQAYIDAHYQDSIVWIPSALKLLHPRPISKVGDATWFAQNYMGDFQWWNHITDCNPDGEVGYFWAKFQYAPEYGRSDLAFVVRHRVCGFANDLVSCPST